MDIETTKKDLLTKWFEKDISWSDGALGAMDEYASFHPKIKELADRNYNAQLKRGTITDKTIGDDFLCKIQEEIDELADSYTRYLYLEKEQIDEKELADIILVCLAMAKHFKIDIFKVLEEKVVYNENRED